jgi:N-acyl-D-aspartate/D-glutamate deacylase
MAASPRFRPAPCSDRAVLFLLRKALRTMHAAILCSLSLLAADPVPADLVLGGGTIYDGAGGEAMTGDVAIRGDRIVAVGQFEVAGTPPAIDCRGLVVAPGFIDLHSHSDSGITQPKTRQNANFLVQGCTTVVTGNCGSGPTDVAAYFRQIDEHGAGTNVLHLLPHGSLRSRVMSGEANRPPTAAELAEMKRLAEQAMRDGACGMATGLIYTPGTFAKTDELVAIAEVVGQHGGIYASHIRNEGSQLLESLDEILTIGKQAKLPVHVSHIKVSGKAAWGLAPDAIQKLRDARSAGQQVTADQYPYAASSTSLSATVIPAELRTWAKLKAALDDPERGPQVRERLARSLREKDDGAAIMVASFAPDRSWQGKNLAQIAALTQQSPVDVVIDIMRRGGAQIVNFGMNEDEVRLFMREPFVATASDGSTQSLDTQAQPHPRSFGTFPRKIGRYAIEGGFLPLAQAIRSASGLPADILRLTDRGYVRAGYFADLVVFDPATFRDVATYEKPVQWATGTKLVLVNGQVAVENEQPTGKLAGRALRHPGKGAAAAAGR